MTYKQMIADLPDLTSQPLSRKRARAAPTTAGTGGFFPKRRRGRITYPTGPSIFAPAVDMTSEIIKNELKNAGKQIVYAAMEKTVKSEKQQTMKEELEKSVAIPALLKTYLGGMENLPGPLQLGVLLAEKYGKVLLT